MRFLAALLASLLTLPALADDATPVLVLGSFHFDNPGRDVVKQADFDVKTPESQSYLEELSQRLAGADQRLLVVGGHGHAAILKQLLAIDRRLQAVDARDFL